MLSDFKPITLHFDKSIKVYAVGDLHVGAPEWNQKAWDQFSEKLLKEPDSYIVILGDMMNNALKSSVSNSYEETMRPREQKELLVNMLRPLAEARKILCGTSGNHEKRSLKDSDDDPLYDVFCKLDIEDCFRENMCFLILRFGNQLANGIKNPTYTMCVTHGAGGGMYIGSSANKLERYGAIIDNLDLLVVGHTHKPITFPVGKLKIDTHNGNIIRQKFTCVVASSWLEYGGYAVRKMLPPAADVLQEIRFDRNQKNIRVLQ